jgi:hypothetical protein
MRQHVDSGPQSSVHPSRPARKRRGAMIAISSLILGTIGVLLFFSSRPDKRQVAELAPAFPWPETVSLVQRSGPSTVFAWDERRFGVLNPNAWEVSVVTADSGAPIETVRLERPPKNRDLVTDASRELYPDVVQRSLDGKVFWLSRSRGRVFVFSETGRFERLVKTELNWPFWMRVGASGRVAVFGTQCAKSFTGYREFDGSGRLIGERLAATEATCTDDSLARFFFRSPADQEIEVFADYARLRVTRAGTTQLRALDAALVPTRFRVATKGAVPDAMGSRGIFALAADIAENGNIFVLVNGGVLLHAALTSAEVSAWRLPRPQQAPAMVLPSALSVSGGHLAVLTQERASRDDEGHVRLRVWKWSQ